MLLNVFDPKPAHNTVTTKMQWNIPVRTEYLLYLHGLLILMKQFR